MYRIRPMRLSDLERLVTLAFEAQLGMTSLPPDKQQLELLLEKVLFSFRDEEERLNDNFYLFGLEEIETSQLVGVSGILAKTGVRYPLDYFQLKELALPPLFPEVPSTRRILERVHYKEGPSELCALFLSPNARKEGLGKLLSLSRFLFMAVHPKRFTDLVFADMRGLINADGSCPFWEGVGRHFLPIEFEELIKRRGHGHHGIAKLMPSHLYVDLLPPSAIDAIGATHQNTCPALQMLLNQGFKKTGEIDLYDAGPRLLAPVETIKTIREAQSFKVAAINDSAEIQVLIANTRLDFRACIGQISAGGIINQATADALEVGIGDELLYITLEKRKEDE